MDVERFEQLVDRLTRDSAAAPGLYRAKVAALALLGFAILALLLGTVGFGLALLLGLLLAIALSGGGALILLLKLGKLLALLLVPMWFLVKSAVQALFVRLPAPSGREVTRAEAPALFEALDDMRRRLRGPRVHHVLVVDAVTAAVVQRPAFGLVGWPRNYLLLGLPALEALPPAEALAVVAHEYGHLAGSHGRFSAFIYRLRNTWGVVQAYADHIQGWLGRLVTPLVRWYAPYFNAYTFVLARADEYAADAAAADLVGASHVAHALKRFNLVEPQHQRFLQQTLERIDHDPRPPADLMQRWASTADGPLPEADARRWLDNALDRRGQVTDTHPTLRARLAALRVPGESDEDPPPLAEGPSAAVVWLGTTLPTLRREFETRWADEVARPWAERHAQAQQLRQRLEQLSAQSVRDADQELERIRLSLRLLPTQDQREPLAAFNGAHPDHALGLFLEGLVRLDHDDPAGLALLDRAIALDPEATKPACERAHTFLSARRETEAAQAYAERWRVRDQLETLRAQQMAQIDGRAELVDLGMDEGLRQAMLERLPPTVRRHVARVSVARRVIPADPRAVQVLLGVELTWWGRRRGKQQEVVNRLAAQPWPLALTVVSLDGPLTKLRRRFRALSGARLV